MTDEEIVERAKEAEKRTGFGELVHSPNHTYYNPLLTILLYHIVLREC